MQGKIIDRSRMIEKTNPIIRHIEKPLAFLKASLLLLLVAMIAVSWAVTLTRSLYTYRSPLHDRPPQPTNTHNKPLTNRLVFVLVDGLRLDTSLQADVMPTLNDLRRKGAWATMHSQPPSYSQPAYTVLMTGASPELSDGPIFNLDYEDIRVWTQDNVFSSAHRARLKTAVAGYYWFEKLIPAEAVNAHFYTPEEDSEADEQVVAAALPWLLSKEYQFVLIHLDQVDYAGHHEGGPRDSRWQAAAYRVDKLLREIVNTLDFSQDTLLICSDHGHVDRGGHGGHEPEVLTEPFLLIGAGIKPGKYEDIHQVDVAPTIAVLLGINLPASSQGKVLTDMLELDEETFKIIQDSQAQQQNTLIEAYVSAVRDGHGKNVEETLSMTLNQVRMRRLYTERSPRLIVLLLAIVIPLQLFLRKRKKELLLFVGSAILYGVAFNIGYLLLGGYSFSFSTIRHERFFLLFIIINITISYAITCLYALATVRGKKYIADSWRERINGGTYVIIYLLSLLVFWYYYLFGATVEWTLPDFSLLFIVLLSLIQIGCIASLGILFNGFYSLLFKMMQARPT